MSLARVVWFSVRPGSADAGRCFAEPVDRTGRGAFAPRMGAPWPVPQGPRSVSAAGRCFVVKLVRMVWSAGHDCLASSARYCFVGI